MNTRMNSKLSVINYPLECSLRLFGCWPHSSFIILKHFIWSTTIIISLVFQSWFCITHIKSSWTDLLDGLCVTLSNSLLLLKLVVIWLYKRTFSDILTTIAEDCNKADSNEEDRRIISNTAIISSRISNFLLGYYEICILTYAGLALMTSDENEETSTTKQRKLLLKMEFPFDFTVSPRYEIIIVLQLIFQCFMVNGAAASIALISVLYTSIFGNLSALKVDGFSNSWRLSVCKIMHVGSQIDLLYQKLTEISYNNGKRGWQKSIITDFIIKHQEIIRLSKSIETIFRYISLYQFLSNMLVICFISFIMVISAHTDGAISLAIKCFPYYTAVNFEAFVLCYTGEYLASKSGIITDAVYNLSWYDFETRDARTLLLVILRSQSQLSLTAGKFLNLSLEAFANMLKASASYVSVLYAMY